MEHLGERRRGGGEPSPRTAGGAPQRRRRPVPRQQQLGIRMRRAYRGPDLGEEPERRLPGRVVAEVPRQHEALRTLRHRCRWRTRWYRERDHLESPRELGPRQRRERRAVPLGDHHPAPARCEEPAFGPGEPAGFRAQQRGPEEAVERRPPFHVLRETVDEVDEERPSGEMPEAGCQPHELEHHEIGGRGEPGAAPVEIGGGKEALLDRLPAAERPQRRERVAGRRIRAVALAPGERHRRRQPCRGRGEQRHLVDLRERREQLVRTELIASARRPRPAAGDHEDPHVDARGTPVARSACSRADSTAGSWA
ncbi:MAG: hypothetical protein BWX64_02808 [Acidobacteria bacterium ADurb.Bin051]|nr:MAG: hypothetical protein BWX64_02808 [Acidobacteria bacterium ADurb.Bin051]